MIRVLSLGAGVQSTALLLMSCRGILPRLDCAIFADTQYEPRGVYEHLAWLTDFAAGHGIPVHRLTVGNLRDDAIAFRASGSSADGKRHASIPFFLVNRDGTDGKLPRQCTGDFKIDPIERFTKTELLKLPRGKRWAEEPAIEQWIGISSDEGGRANYPGLWVNKITKGKDLLGRDVKHKTRVWRPMAWKVHHYPFLQTTLLPSRRSKTEGILPPMTRDEIKAWLAREFPDRQVPRSACIGCPFRSNEEWRLMRDTDPESWADAIDFDRQIRRADSARQQKRNMLVGTPYLHVQRVPLDQVNLDAVAGHQGATGCGSLFDCGTEAGCDSGMCGV